MPRQLTHAALAGVVVVAKLDAQLNDRPDANGNEAHGSNLGHDLLDVGSLFSLAQQRSGAAKEGLQACEMRTTTRQLGILSFPAENETAGTAALANVHQKPAAAA